MADVFICDAVRTPIGRYGGALSSIRADDLGALPIAALLARQANLDPAAVRGVEELIGAIGAAGTKILMTTHDIAQARRLAADVMFLNHGRLLEHAPATEFFASPKDPVAAGFLAGELPA